MKKLKLFFCLVNYKTTQDIVSYIQNMKKGNNIDDVYFIIFENSGELFSDFLDRKDSNILYVNKELKNIGYLNGLGLSLKEGVKNWGVPDWAIFSNSDLIFSSSDLFSSLKSKNIPANTGILSYDIIASPSLNNQNPFLRKRPQKIKILSYLLIYSNIYTFFLYNLLSKIKGNIKKKKKMVLKNDTKFEYIYAAHGAFFCLSKVFIENSGTIKWPVFLYGEELWFAEKCREHNLKVIINPEILIIHEEHRSTSLLSLRNKRISHYESMKFIYKKFWSE